MLDKEYQGAYHLETVPPRKIEGFELVTSTLILIVILVDVVAPKDQPANAQYNYQIYTRSIGGG
jgi:hypothetical protein